MHWDRKRIGIIIAVAVMVTIFWLVAGHWMREANRFDDWVGILLSGSLLTLTAMVMAVGFLLLARGSWPIYAAGLAVLAFFATNGITPLYLVGGAIAFIAWYAAATVITRELNERRKIRISSILTHGLPKILFGLYLLASFAFYLTPASQNITQKEATTAFRAQVDKTSDLVLQSELEKLPAYEREQVKQQVSSQAVKTFVGFLNFQFCITPDTCTPSVLELLPPLYAFFFFLTLWGFGFIFRELGVLLGAGTFTFLRGSHLVSIEQEDAKVDVLKI